MEKEIKPKKETIVVLNDDLYFVVSANDFELRKRGLKADKTIGYFSNIETLIQSATQIVISESGTKINFKEFVELWKQVQDSLTGIIKRMSIK